MNREAARWTYRVKLSSREDRALRALGSDPRGKEPGRSQTEAGCAGSSWPREGRRVCAHVFSSPFLSSPPTSRWASLPAPLCDHMVLSRAVLPDSWPRGQGACLSGTRS